MTSTIDLENWLREQCADYSFDLRGVYQARGSHDWPLVAKDEADLEAQIMAGGHLLPLPKEPAALANVLEVSVVDFLVKRFARVDGALTARGSERHYPDLEVTGAAFGGGFHAVDIKMARRGKTKTGVSSNTQSRVTLYTGNTYFRWQSLHWPGTFRPFEDYTSHLDVIGIYTFTEDSAARVDDLELIVQPAWKVASRQRSSTTREYIGAVQNIEALRSGRGDFSAQQEFYKFWHNYPFKIGSVVERQLQKLLDENRKARGS